MGRVAVAGGGGSATVDDALAVDAAFVPLTRAMRKVWRCGEAHRGA